MKVVFLDIDGVLNDYITITKNLSIFIDTGKEMPEIDEAMVANLKEIVDNTDAKIVLSSSWRLYGKMVDGKLSSKKQKVIDFINILSKYNLEIYDITPYGHSRGLEILDWMDGKDIESYIILDDELEELRLLPRENIIKTYFDDSFKETGLTKDHVNIAINKLNNGKRLVK